MFLTNCACVVATLGKVYQGSLEEAGTLAGRKRRKKGIKVTKEMKKKTDGLMNTELMYFEGKLCTFKEGNFTKPLV